MILHVYKCLIVYQYKLQKLGIYFNCYISIYLWGEEEKKNEPKKYIKLGWKILKVLLIDFLLAILLSALKHSEQRKPMTKNNSKANY